MNHFETCLMVSSPKVDSKVPRMASKLKNFDKKNFNEITITNINLLQFKI